jgi:hypothetical protein
VAGQQERRFAEALIADGAPRTSSSEQPPQEIIDGLPSVASIARCLQKPVRSGIGQPQPRGRYRARLAGFQARR